jgi:hypothetical protein
MPYSDPRIALTHNSWKSMMRRCYNRSHERYQNYGAAGVVVCKRWHSFKLFLEDMGIRPVGTVIDRLQNCKTYSPETCRWATYKQSTENRGNTIWINLGSERMRVNDFSKLTNIPIHRIYSRLARGWTPGEIMAMPKLKHGYSKNGPLNYNEHAARRRATSESPTSPSPAQTDPA